MCWSNKTGPFEQKCCFEQNYCRLVGVDPPLSLCAFRHETATLQVLLPISAVVQFHILSARCIIHLFIICNKPYSMFPAVQKRAQEARSATWRQARVRARLHTVGVRARVLRAVVGCGLWAVGCGLWAVGCRQWAAGTRTHTHTHARTHTHCTHTAGCERGL